MMHACLSRLGELGQEQLKGHLVVRLFDEILVRRTIAEAAIDSLYYHWIPVLRDDKLRVEIEQSARSWISSSFPSFTYT